MKESWIDFYRLIALLLAAVLLPASAMAQYPAAGVVPEPLVGYAGFANEEDIAEGADGEEGEEEDDDLDFLDQDISEIRNTQVAAPAMSEEVSSVSRTAQPIAKTPAAVYVITNEMIKRSGARNIPDVLRMVPGLHVARISSNMWAISIRGFNSQYANKLLVQIDGRAVYTPTFSGVLWGQQRLLLEDVERIEVIRGPGGTVWGANAVNGIISITTKSSADTQGLYGEIGGGNEHELFSGVRAGGAVNENLTFRLWGTQTLDDQGYVPLATPDDGFSAGQGGFRTDWTPTRCDTITMQGDFLGADVGTGPGRLEATTANTLARWTHRIDDNTDWSFQTYWDDYTRDNAGMIGAHVSQQVYDLDYQFHTKAGCYHDVVAGFGFRNYSTTMEFTPASPLLVTPPRDNFGIISYFVQDTIELVDETFFTTIGCKFEHNDFTGFEYQPTVRGVWIPNERTSIWASIGRAVRTPSVIDRDLIYNQLLNPGPPFATIMSVGGNPTIGSEDVISYEMGLRRQPTDEFFWDIAAFFSRYNDLMIIQPTGMVAPPPAMILNFLSVNGADADTYGFEWTGTYEVNECWNIRGNYSFFVENIDIPAGMQTFVTNPGLTPKNMAYLASGWNLNCCTTLDFSLRYVDALAIGIPSYLVADVRLAREFGNGIETAIVGQNLLDSEHPEFQGTGLTTINEVESGVYGMLSFKY